MTNTSVDIKANNFGFEHIGWKYYNKLKKKAMEQEFSWSGLIVSLSIAFFIVIATAVCLSLLYHSLEGATGANQYSWQNNGIYRLETSESGSFGNYIQPGLLSPDQIESISQAPLV